MGTESGSNATNVQHIVQNVELSTSLSNSYSLLPTKSSTTSPYRKRNFQKILNQNYESGQNFQNHQNQMDDQIQKAHTSISLSPSSIKNQKLDNNNITTTNIITPPKNEITVSSVPKDKSQVFV